MSAHRLWWPCDPAHVDPAAVAAAERAGRPRPQAHAACGGWKLAADGQPECTCECHVRDAA